MIRVCSICLADSAMRCPPAVARRAGFSLVELLVVVAGIGLLMALIAGMLAALRASAQAATCASICGSWPRPIWRMRLTTGGL